MLLQPKKVLVLAPHPDDGELGCGGTLARLIREGAEVHYSVFSLCEISLPEGISTEDIQAELKAATSHIGIDFSNVRLKNYPVRRFSQFRQDILEDIIQLRQQLQPDLVFVPASSDIHQDHQVVYQESLRAYKQSSILGYELPWNAFEFKASFHVTLEQADLQKKIDALLCYKSQQFRPYFQGDFVRSLATIRGTQVAQPYAEAFEAIKLRL